MFVSVRFPCVSALPPSFTADNFFVELLQHAFVIHVYSFCAVSYTHLDVYKRQIVYRSSHKKFGKQRYKLRDD